MSAAANVGFWWRSKKGEVHKDVFATINHIDTYQKYREDANLKHLRLYGNADIMGLAAHQYARPAERFGNGNLTFNVIQSVIDTVHSRIGKNRPKPTFLTEDGNYSLQRKAKKLDKYIEGKFYGLDLYSLGQKAFLASCVFDIGAVKFYPEGEEIKAEWVFSNELKWDDAEAVYGKPLQLHQTKVINREALKEIYTSRSDRDMIDRASRYESDYSSIYSLADQVKVVESWKLPSAPGAKDGRHTICIDNCDFVDEPYEKDYYPFVFLRWKDRLLGFAGQGLAERLTPIQFEMNRILLTISECLKWSVPKLLVKKGTKIPKNHFDNSIASIWEYLDVAPQMMALQTVSPELFSQLDRLYQRAFEEAGVSQLSAQSQKPTGLDSGRALREFNDIESDRHAVTAQNYEGFYMDAAKIIVDLSRDLYEQGHKLIVKAKGSKFIEQIPWKDVDMKDDQYMMQIFPTSMLPQTPAGKLQAVQELIQSGFYTKEEGFKLLDFPDTEAVNNSKLAASDDIDATIERLLSGKAYEPPEPFQNLMMGIERMQSAYLRGRNNGAPESALENLRRWMREAEKRLEPPKKPAAPMPTLPMMPPAPGMMPPSPMGVPEPLPTSDLLPAGGMPPAL